jgi:glyoxylase-like metal-dependent hydrolase (beta-lactamase superfamily II)
MSRSLTSLEGNTQRLDGGAMFGNVPRALWSRWIDPDERHRIPLACRCLLVRDGERNILFESGIGAFFAPDLKERYGVVESRHVLLDSLREAGLGPEDVDAVVLSHLHFDHAGGLLTEWREGGEPELVFPRARFIVGADAWQRAQYPHPRDRASFIPELNRLLAGSGRLEVVEEEGSPTLGDGYRFHVSHGHTPGLLLAEIEMPEGPVVFAADLIPGAPWVHLPITMGYDRFPELLIDEKQRLLGDLIERGGRLFYTHDSKVALSSLARDEKGRFGPAEPQSAIAGLEH